MGRQHFHPSAAKAWAKWGSGGSLTVGYRVSSVTKNSAGNFSVNFASAMSSANYGSVANGGDTGGRFRHALRGRLPEASTSSSATRLDRRSTTTP